MRGIRFFQPGSTISDMLWTFFTQGLILVATIVLFKLAATAFGQDGFGEYTLARRIASLSLPLVTLGFGVALSRYISRLIKHDSHKQASYIMAASVSIISFSIFVMVVLNVFPCFFSKTLFGDQKYVTLVFPLSIMVFGLALYGLVYSYYRGQMLLKMANLLEIIVIGILPISFVLMISNITVDLLILLTGLGLTIVSLIFGIPIIKEILYFKRYRHVIKHLKELLRYGLPRVPGEFALLGLAALGPIIAAHLKGTVLIKEVGYLSVSLSLVAVISSGIAGPMNIVLLPRISSLLSEGKNETVRVNLNYLTSAISHLSVFATVQLIVFADTLVEHWLGREFIEAGMIVRIIALSAIFTLIFSSLKGPIDAASVKAINARNTYIALAVFLATSFAMLTLYKAAAPIVSLAIAATVGYCALGILTWFSAKKLFGLALEYKKLFLSIFLAVSLGVAGVFVKRFIGFGSVVLVKVGIIQMVFVAVYILLLGLCRIEWPGELFTRVIRRDKTC